jgi:hypothetical protein
MRKLFPILLLGVLAHAAALRADSIDQFTILEDIGSAQETFSFSLPAVNTGMGVLGLFDVPVTMSGPQFTPGTYSSVVDFPTTHGLVMDMEQFGGEVVFSYNPVDTLWTSSGPGELSFVQGSESTDPLDLPPNDHILLTITGTGPVATPEPGMLALLFAGLLGLGFYKFWTERKIRGTA